MPADLPISAEQLFLDNMRRGNYWIDLFVHKKNPNLEEATEPQSWQDYKKSEKDFTRININDLINNTPKSLVTIKPKTKPKELPKVYTRQDLFKEICSFKSLNNNWDGYSAIPLEIQSAANAMFLISCLDNNIFEAIDQVFPNPHGTISIIWHNSQDETVSLEIGNNKIAYYVDIPNQETEFFDNIEINDSELAKLAIFINRII